jgi:hypothetical protein
VRLSNYEVTKKKMQQEFLKYDQADMIEKFALQCEDAYLYLAFVGRMYRIGRSDGLVEGREAHTGFWTEAGFNEAMSIYDVLCCSKPACHLTGEFAKVDSLPGVVHTTAAAPGCGPMTEIAAFFDAHTRQLIRACEQLGGTPEHHGDVSYRLPVFDFLPVLLQFWKSDEEFPASLQFMWDKNVLSYLHYETTFYVVSHILERINMSIAAQ